ncbi:MAG TPA: carbohydrate ABC transporter permease [Actinospica sp.]|jgi:multiple sugar transport system permease protein|nr:carbohydrate ABC transporter permease [Actinospica sp.]
MTAQTSARTVPSPAARGTASATARKPPAKGRRGSPNLLVVLGLSLTVIYSVAPIWWLIVSATKNQSDLYNTNGLWFAHFNLWRNLRDIGSYDGGYFYRWMLNTAVYSGSGAFVGTLIALAAGYSLSRYRFWGRKYIFAAVVGSFLLPSALLTFPLYLLFAKVGLVGTPLSVIIPACINPFSVYLAKVYVDGAVPVELLEAARIDGAGELRIFGSIVVRLMSTGAATIFLLAFVSSWNGFYLPLTMLGSAGKANWTLALGLYDWSGQRELMGSGVDGTSMLITGALLSVIPLALFMIAMQRFWKKGVTLGAIK